MSFLLTTVNKCLVVSSTRTVITPLRSISLHRPWHTQKGPSTAQSKIKAVIFDFDGVLIDSETIFMDINRKCLAHFGREYTRELKQGQMGRKLTEGVDYLLKRTQLAEQGVKPSDYLTIYNALLEVMLCNIPEMPGARRLVEHFNDHSIPMAICTGSATEEFMQKTLNCQHFLQNIPLIVLAGDDPEVKDGKPAPDPYLVTMKRMIQRHKVPWQSNEFLIFEDSVNGVRSALSARNTVVMVPQEEFMPDNWSEMRHRLESDPNLVEILPSLEHFDPSEYGLPPLKS